MIRLSFALTMSELEDLLPFTNSIRLNCSDWQFISQHLIIFVIPLPHGQLGYHFQILFHGELLLQSKLIPLPNPVTVQYRLTIHSLLAPHQPYFAELHQLKPLPAWRATEGSHTQPNHSRRSAIEVIVRLRSLKESLWPAVATNRSIGPSSQGEGAAVLVERRVKTIPIISISRPASLG